MAFLKKKQVEEPKAEKPFNPPVIKTDAHCVVEGCLDEKAPGQTHVCSKHVRTN